ncbi:MAG TPA: glycine--tRNA ligase [Phycisphaerae bacterium]|nr:glycine--tRNA ligase [Phycisphaerae bacterium]
MANEQDRMERIVALAKRRGFIFPGSEIYGGLNGFWDYGPLGVELKRNIKDAWWHDCVTTRDDMVGVDAAIIMNPKVWEASGHVTGFTDPMVDCKACKTRYRADSVAHFELYEIWSGWTDPKNPPAMGLFNSLQPGSAEARETGLRFIAFLDVTDAELQAAVRRMLESKRARVVHVVEEGMLAEDSGYICVQDGNRAYWLGPGLVDATYRCLCGGGLTEARQFNLMFKTHVGALEDSSSLAYLRPETAQGIFVNYKNVLDTSRLKVPFGIAQIGKAFRNEINPRNYTFRSREFEQMEIEFFCHPGEADKWYATWRQARFDWYVGLGLKSDRLRLRDHEKDELAHYANACADIEYAFPFGVAELEGVANRTDFDLKQHQEFSGRDMTYYDDETKERFLPYVIEPSGGVDRALLAFLCEAYDEDEAPDEKGKAQKRTVLRFHPRLAPIKVAVFPLVKKDGMPEKARAIYEECRRHLAAFYDEKGAVGRRYRRQDEAGTPFCVTVDGQTFEDGTVTIRDRDTMKQERIQSESVLGYVREHLHL